MEEPAHLPTCARPLSCRVTMDRRVDGLISHREYLEGLCAGCRWSFYRAYRERAHAEPLAAAGLDLS
jgi:hypothetical protein